MIYTQEFYYLCVTVLGDKAHETSASWDYTLQGYTPETFWGIELGQEYMQKSRELHRNIRGNLISNHLMTNSKVVRETRLKDRKFRMGSVQTGVGAKFPMFRANCSCLLLYKGKREESEQKRRTTKQNKTRNKERRKTKKRRKQNKNGTIPHKTIYTNPLKNFQMKVRNPPLCWKLWRAAWATRPEVPEKIK